MQVIAGSTDVSISIYCRALSGAALTGKVAADFVLTYRRAGANVALSLSNLANLAAAHTDGGLYEVGQGEYRLDLPDAACATGADQLSVTGTVGGGVVLGYPIALDTGAAGVWASATRTLTQSAAAVTTAVSGTTLTIQRGDTLSASFTGLGNITARTKLWITGKRDKAHADTLAVFRIEESVGLEYINGAAAVTAGNGSIAVTNATTGALTVTLAAIETAKLSEMIGGAYDIQMLTATGVSTLTDATLVVTQDVTRAVS